jgi:hypothetical protein
MDNNRMTTRVALDLRLSGGWRLRLFADDDARTLVLDGHGDSHEYALSNAAVPVITESAHVPAVFRDAQDRPVVFFLHRTLGHPSLVWICDQRRMGWMPERPERLGI